MLRLRALVFASALCCALGPVLPGLAQQEAPEFVLALTGDSIITRRLAVYSEPAFTRVIELVRGADAAFTNLEMLFHDYEPYASAASGGTYMRADPALVKDLVWAGFDMVGRANNHSGDYGVLGMNLTTRYVAEAGIVQAGVGQSLAEAREAKFLETARGRVALVSVASTFPDSSRAGRTRGDMPARPGLNPLRFTTTATVTPARLATLREIASEVSGRPPQRAGDSLTFMGTRFVAGPTPGIRTEPLKIDLDEIVAVVRNASALADYTVVSIHAHEGGRDRTLPADFLVAFAHAVIDAGADMLIGHGPHVLRGVEIYKGKPIFYSLGDFIFQNETLLRLPSENYEPYGLGATAHVNDFNDARYNFDKSGFPADRLIWEGAVAVPRFRGEHLTELALHPVTLGFGKPRSVRGRPMFAEGELGQKILGDLARLSASMGTTITIRNGVGYVSLPTASNHFFQPQRRSDSQVVKDAAMGAYGDDILEQMVPGRGYEASEVNRFVPELSAEALREIMHGLWIERKVERFGYSGWRRVRSTSRQAPDTPAAVNGGSVRGVASGENRPVKPEDLFDHDAFAGWFK